MANRWGNSGNSESLYFGGFKITADVEKMLAPCEKNYDQPRHHIKKNRDITLPTKVHLVKDMVFPVVCMDARVGL